MNKKSRVIRILCVVITMLLCFTGCGSNSDPNTTGNENSLPNIENVGTEQRGGSDAETVAPIQEDNSISETVTPNNQIAATDLVPSEGLGFESNGDGTCTIVGIGESAFSGCADSLAIIIAGKNYAADDIKDGVK